MSDWSLVVLIALPLIIVVLVSWFLAREIRNKNIHTWGLKWLFNRSRDKQVRPVHVLFCFVDHFEPAWHKPDIKTEHSRVDRWLIDYPKLAMGHKDADGCFPKHTFFFPEEEYRPEHLDKLHSLCKMGLGEVEIHLHHDNDTEANLRQTLRRFGRLLRDRHNMLPSFPDSEDPVFAFIHGNWSLDNSRSDGRYCGINNELDILMEEGCYADFTLPSAPSDTQTSKINSIYYAIDDPIRPKSHDTGRNAEVGQVEQEGLMMIQGPLGFDFANRKWGLIPRIENADIRASQPPTKARVDLWVDTGIHVEGKPDWVFVKVHTHGCQETDMDTLLGAPTDEMFSYLEEKYNDGSNYILHYVTAREMFNLVKAAEKNMPGNPGEYRDFVLAPPRSCVDSNDNVSTSGPECK